MNNTPAPANFSGLKPYGRSDNGRTILANAQHQQFLNGLEQLSKSASSEGYHAQAAVKAVNNLRGCASPVNSFIKDGNPNRRCIVFSGFEIEYELNSYYGGPQTDVEIVDIRLTPQTKDRVKKAALWRTSYQTARDQWIAADQPEAEIKGDAEMPGNGDKPIKVGINGYCDNLDHAAGMLPEHIARGEKAALGKLRKSGYQLFYVPQGGSSLKAGWKFLRDLGRTSSSDLQAAHILAGHMKEAHQRGLHVEWTSHRGGSKVLTQAIKLLAKGNINLAGKQKIFLSDHTSSHFEADIARRAVGMDTDDSKWHNATPGLAQLIGGRAFGAADLSCSINELLYHTPREERAGKMLETVINGKKTFKSAAAAGTSVAVLVNTLGVSAAFASALVSTLGSMALASVPSLNEGYHKGPADPAKQLANKLLSKK